MTRIAALTLVCLAATACTQQRPDGVRADAEARIADELRNYQLAGAPVSCVNLRDLEGNRSVGNDAIIFEARGNRLYVNRPPGGCPQLKFSRFLQTRTTTTRLCRGDIATVADATSGIDYGGCGLGDFEPYRRLPQRL